MSETPVLRGGRSWLAHAKWAVVLATFGALAALILPAINQERGSRRDPCKNNLNQLGLALQSYHDTYGSFPPAITYGPDGKPWHSWRVLLMPFLVSQKFSSKYRFDEPWNGPNNRKLAAEIGPVPIFRCPQDTDAAPVETSYLAVIGPETMWLPDRAATFVDRADRTVHLVEVSDSGVHWMEPQDLRLDAMSVTVGTKSGPAIRGRHGGKSRWFREDVPSVALAELVDGSVQALSSETPAETVRSLLIRNDDGPNDF